MDKNARKVTKKRPRSTSSKSTKDDGDNHQARPKPSKPGEGSKEDPKSRAKTTGTIPFDIAGWHQTWKAKLRIKSLKKGIVWMVDSRDFETVPEVYNIANLTSDPIRQDALEHVQRLLDRWKDSCLMSYLHEPPQASNSEHLNTVLRQLCQLEQVGTSHPAKSKILASCIESQGFDERGQLVNTSRAVQYLGFDPMSEKGPQGSLRKRFTALDRALETLYLAQMTGCDLCGASRIVDVMKHISDIRPYRGPHELESDPGAYAAQTMLAIRLVQTLSREGELRIPATLLPHEYYYLRQHLAVFLLYQDILMSARILDALRVLGGQDDDPLFRIGLSFLMGTQLANGSWPASPSPHALQEPDLPYRTTSAALRALALRDFKGYGPLPLEAVEVLLAWQAADADAPKDEGPVQLPAMGERIHPTDGSIDTRAQDFERVAKRMLKAIRAKSRISLQKVNSAVSQSLPLAVSASDSSLGEVGRGQGGGKQADIQLLPSVSSVAAKVQEHARRLEAARKRDSWSEIVLILMTLRQESSITADILASTGIGRSVNALKKQGGDETVVKVATELIKAWKSMVKGN